MSFAITRPNCNRKTGNKNYLAMCNCVTTYLPNVSNSFLLFVYQTSIEEEKIVFPNFLFQLPCALRWQNTKNCIHSFSVNFANFHSHRVCNKPFRLFVFFSHLCCRIPRWAQRGWAGWAASPPAVPDWWTGKSHDWGGSPPLEPDKVRENDRFKD